MAVVFDVLIVAVLTAFAITWFARGWRYRLRTLWFLSAFAAASSGLWLFMGRWQAAASLVVAVVFMLVTLVSQWRHRPAKANRPWLTTGLLASLILPVVFLFAMWPVAPLPAPTGPNRVGVMDFELVDRARTGVLEDAPGIPRKLKLRIWYPAEPGRGQARPYALPHELETFRDSARGALPEFISDHFTLIPTHSHIDAPVLRSAKGLPLVLYSHGYINYYQLNSLVAEDLASHGYVVVGIAHPHDALAMTADDGTPLPRSEEDYIGHDSAGFAKLDKSWDDWGKITGDALFARRFRNDIAYMRYMIGGRWRINRSGPVWIQDRMFVLEALARGQVPEKVRRVVAATDTRRVAHMGMSFGGGMAGSTCMIDPRCAAVVSFDGADTAYLPFDAQSPAPVLTLASDEFMNYWGMQFSYETLDRFGLRPDIFRVNVKNARHGDLTDYPALIGQPLRSWLFFGTIGTRDMIGVQRDFTRGFLDRYMRNRGQFPEPQLQRYATVTSRIDGTAVRRWWLGRPPAERERAEALIAAARKDTRQQVADCRVCELDTAPAYAAKRATAPKDTK